MKPELPPKPHFSQQDIADRCEELLRLSGNREPNLREIARRTSEIPELAQLVVQRANSAKIGLRHRVSDVDHAVVLLGADRIRGLVRQLLFDTARLHALADRVNRSLVAPPGTQEDQADSAET